MATSEDARPVREIALDGVEKDDMNKNISTSDDISEPVSNGVKRLAALARLTVNDAELEKFSKEFDGILAYVGQIESLVVSKEGVVVPAVRNVFRKDGVPHESGKYTEAITAQFPARDGDALKVKQIITHD